MARENNTTIQTADAVARQYNVSREAQSAFALLSQQKAVASIDDGRFRDEIVPVMLPQRKKDPVPFTTDEYPKRDTNLEKLARLKPIYKDGVVPPETPPAATTARRLLC